MKKYLLSFLIIMGFVFCQSEGPVVQVGFESVIEQDDGSYLLSIYAINKEPVAGVQFQLMPELFVEKRNFLSSARDDLINQNL